MPRNKDLKRLVRARMGKTGESYTAARAKVVARTSVRTTRPSTPAPVVERSAPAADYAALAGMSDAVIKAKTGCTWERWVDALDRRGAAKLTHGEIAALVSTKYKVGDWWTQMVTVGYERIKGLRARGQQRNGTYTMNRSRTFGVNVETLYDAWADGRRRKRWLDETGVKVRTATAPKSLRLQMPDGAIVAVGFSSKGKGKSAVALEQARLPDRAAAEALKQLWSERLDALEESLS